MKAIITYSESAGKTEYYSIIIIVNEKEIPMRVVLEDGVVSTYQSKDSDKWNAFSNEEKEAVENEIRAYYNY